MAPGSLVEPSEEAFQAKLRAAAAAKALAPD
jgi:hypothetical protein